MDPINQLLQRSLLDGHGLVVGGGDGLARWRDGVMPDDVDEGAAVQDMPLPGCEEDHRVVARVEGVEVVRCPLDGVLTHRTAQRMEEHLQFRLLSLEVLGAVNWTGV
jgi:hypothetical protein